MTKRVVTMTHDEAEEAIPVWVRVFHWQMQRTRLQRKLANHNRRDLKVAERPPVKMRDFPQFADPGPDAYSVGEYEELRREWIQAGSPCDLKELARDLLRERPDASESAAL